MRKDFRIPMAYAMLIIAAACVYTRAEMVDSSVLAAPGHEAVNSNEPAETPATPASAELSTESEVLPPPPVYELKPEYRQALQLTAAQEAALHKYLPTFKIWGIQDFPPSITHYPYSDVQLPYIVKGDFDGNGKADYIVSGHSGAKNIILAVMAQTTGYTIIQLDTEAMQGPAGHPYRDVLFLVKKGDGFYIDPEDGYDSADIMDNDSIQITQVTAEDTSFSERADPAALYKFEGVIDNIYEKYYEPGQSSVQAEVSSKTFSAFKPEYTKALALTPAMQKAVLSYDKDFKIWTMQDYPADVTESYPFSARSLPYAVKADFNGDGINDMVLAGHNENGNRLLVLLSSGTAYTIPAWSVTSGSCYSEARKAGKQLPYRPSHKITLAKKNFKYLNSANHALPKVTMNTETYNVEQIAKCKRSGRIDPVQNIYGDIYGEWHTAPQYPELFGYVRRFHKHDAYSWSSLKLAGK